MCYSLQDTQQSDSSGTGRFSHLRGIFSNLFICCHFCTLRYWLLTCRRGTVKLWKPKVTPMSELAPQAGLNTLPASTTDGETYIQKTSLAADKPVYNFFASLLSLALF